MKYRTTYVFLVIMLLTGAVFAGAIKINTNEEKPSFVSATFNENDAELPIWKVGDSWTYDIVVDGGLGTDIDFDLTIENFKLEVVEVQSDRYKLDLSVPKGDVEGGGSVDMDIITLSGDLLNTEMDGTMYVNKSDLGIIESNVEIDGYIDRPIADIHFTADLSCTFYNEAEEETVFAPLKFPMNVGDSWMVPFTYIWLEVDVYFDLIPDLLDQYMTLLINETEELECTGIKSVTVPSGTYDTLEVSRGSNNKFWYAVEAGNIIEVDYQNMDLGWGWILNTLEMELISTTYEPPNDPPGAPNKPTGPTSGRAGPAYEYCTSGGDDPEDDQVQYGFDWGDDTCVTWTDLVDSGEQACASHSYASGGTYKIKAKTRDEKGGESGWSSELTVNMVPNDPPSIPTMPAGDETTGTVGYSYDFSTSSSDPEDDQIKYGWDLDEDGTVDEWTNLYDSDALCTSSLIWTKDGTFNLKVKARDQYGATSDWSDTITVTMSNVKPNKPDQPSGPATGDGGTKYTYTTTTTDPDGHRIKYWFDWGDGTNSGWVGPFNSGTEGQASHTWNQKGDYEIKVKAKDEYESDETEWSDPLTISMPRNKANHRLPFILGLLDKFPMIQKLFSLPIFTPN